MPHLSQLLADLTVLEQVGPDDPQVATIQFDSRHISPGDVFVAVRGTQVDGHRFIAQTIAGGASAIVCERLPEDRDPAVTYVRVDDAANALGLMAQVFHGYPSHRLRLVGVTGTNGKTTTATLLYKLFRALGHRSGLLSTIRNYVDDEAISSTHTTGDPLQIADLMARMVAAGCTHCFMEVTSHAIHQQRIAGLQFVGAVFTNLTQDHLDYHLTMEAYRDVKKSFVDGLSPAAFALTNADDPAGKLMTSGMPGRRSSYGRDPGVDFRLEILDADFKGLGLRINDAVFESPLVGTFNAYNLAAAFGAAVLLGEPPREVASTLATLMPIEGRMEKITGANDATVVVDFAHSPDALEKVLASLRDLAGHRRVISVVGCGGDRDRVKRPLMAAAAVALSDTVFFTSDNPRSESPDQIITEMLAGVTPELRDRVLIVPDRREAIRLACAQATRETIVLVAGKGHEKFQEIARVRHPFDDVAEVKAALAESALSCR